MGSALSLIYQACHFVYDVLLNSSGYQQVQRYNDIFQEQLNRIQEHQDAFFNRVHEVRKTLPDVTALCDRLESTWKARKTLLEQQCKQEQEHHAYLQKFTPITTYLDRVAALSEATNHDCKQLDSFRH